MHSGRTLPRVMQTDVKRLQQVLKNLLSNAFKFTERGRVTLSAQLVTSGWTPTDGPLARSGAGIAFSVRDTGIGIAPEKQQIIFEPFLQADGSTSRKYGGTGLGLAISREIAIMLGGEIRLSSAVGQGSTFTLYLPVAYSPQKVVTRRDEATMAHESRDCAARRLSSNRATTLHRARWRRPSSTTPRRFDLETAYYSRSKMISRSASW